MATTTRWTAEEKFEGAGNAAALGRELSLVFDETVTVTVEPDKDPDGHPGENLITITSASALDEVTLDAALAAFPTILEGVTGTFAASKNTNYLLHETSVTVGELVALDVHLLAAFGDQDNFNPQYVDWYVLAWRESSGDVDTATRGTVTLGSIPGLTLSAVGTAETVRIYLRLQRAGQLTIIENDVEEEARGLAPAP